MTRDNSLSVGTAVARRRRRIGALVVLVAAIGLAACSSGDQAPPPSAQAMLPAGPTPVLPPITADQLVGNWGLGSYREAADLARTTAEARRFCSNPYVISAGQQGGVMMYLADQSQPSELFIKESAGRVFIGPPGPAGTAKDRQILSFQDGVMITAWVDPSVTARYGTMVFVKCPGGAAPAAAT